jgi:hypothetical protein
VIRQPNTIVADKSTTGDSTVLHDLDYKVRDQFREIIMLEIRNHTSTPTFSVQPKQSLDGSNWYSLGSAIAATGLTQLTCYCPYFKVNVASITGGSIDVVAG